jgi:predicted nucleic acid-binding Zn ribbon protein
VSTWRPLGPSRSEADPRRLSESLDRVIKGWGSPSSGVVASVFSGWEDLVGPDIAAHATPVSLRDGRLVLMVDQPAWAAQLRFMTSDLIARLDQVVGSEKITDVHIRVAGESVFRDRRKGRSGGA